MYGRLQFNILAAIGEFEREMIKERSTEGRIKAIERGVKFGAKPKLKNLEIQALIRDFEAPGCSKTVIAEHYGISRASVYKLYSENRHQVSEIWRLERKSPRWPNRGLCCLKDNELSEISEDGWF